MVPIPLTDNVRRTTFWVSTLSLIVVNVWVFLYELSLGPNINRLVFLLGIVPARYTTARGIALNPRGLFRPHLRLHVSPRRLAAPARQHAVSLRLWAQRGGPLRPSEVLADLFRRRARRRAAAHLFERRLADSQHRRQRGDRRRPRRLFCELPAGSSQNRR